MKGDILYNYIHYIMTLMVDYKFIRNKKYSRLEIIIHFLSPLQREDAMRQTERCSKCRKQKKNLHNALKFITVTLSK